MNFLELYLVIVGAVVFGYITAALFVETGIVNWLGAKTLPLAKFGIHPLLTQVPALYLVSPRAAHILASRLLKEGKIKPLDLYITVLASNFPMRLMFLYRYYLPVLLPLIGLIAIYYALLRLVFDLLLLLAVSLLGRLRYKGSQGSSFPEYPSPNLSLKTFKEGILKGIKEGALFVLKFTPLFAGVVLLIKIGAMKWLTVKLKPLFGKLGFNSLEITYITTAAISPPVAYGLIKVMIKEGIPTAHILGTMAVGNAMFSLLRSWWSYLLPYYLGLYPLRITASLLLLQAGLPILYNFIVGITLVKWF